METIWRRLLRSSRTQTSFRPSSFRLAHQFPIVFRSKQRSSWKSIKPTGAERPTKGIVGASSKIFTEQFSLWNAAVRFPFAFRMGNAHDCTRFRLVCCHSEYLASAAGFVFTLSVGLHGKVQYVSKGSTFRLNSVNVLTSLTSHSTPPSI
jgi:hypothetical protein